MEVFQTIRFSMKPSDNRSKSSASVPSGPEVFDYLNYRIFLKDFFKAQKKKPDGITQKQALHAMRVSSTGFLSNVFAGRKNLTPPQVTSLIHTMELDKVEAPYFENLVWFTQAKTLEEKNELFARLMTQQRANLKVLDPRRHTIFAKWYYPYVRELLSFFDCKEGYSQLARMIVPEVSEEEVRESIDALAGMDLIERDDKGFWRQKDPAISTGDEVRSRQLARFQMISMDLAKRALEEIPASERDISVMTFSLSPDGFRMAKREIQHFRKRMARLALEDTGLNRVFQFNMQLFPVSKVRNK
jgi:uncharacterized protein (TIGR02147 family)